MTFTPLRREERSEWRGMLATVDNTRVLAALLMFIFSSLTLVFCQSMTVASIFLLYAVFFYYTLTRAFVVHHLRPGTACRLCGTDAWRCVRCLRDPAALPQQAQLRAARAPASGTLSRFLPRMRLAAPFPACTDPRCRCRGAGALRAVRLFARRVSAVSYCALRGGSRALRAPSRAPLASSSRGSNLFVLRAPEALKYTSAAEFRARRMERISGLRKSSCAHLPGEVAAQLNRETRL